MRQDLLAETLDALSVLRHDFVEDQVTFARRRRQLDGMLADMAEIRNALNWSYVEEQPA